MFPDIARDDVFRLETQRLWLRWPRVSDAACDRALLLEMGGRALHRAHSAPLSQGQRRALRLRRARGQCARARSYARADADRARRVWSIGAISLERRGTDRLTLGYALAPEVWGRGLRHRGGRGDGRCGVHAVDGVGDRGQRAGRESGVAPRAGEGGLRPCRPGPARRARARRDGRMRRLRLSSARIGRRATAPTWLEAAR